MTPLMHAAYAGHIDAVRVLLEAGADVNAAAANGWTTALLLADEKGHTDIVEILKEAGGKL
jgi:ankyrin repeat protein